MHPMERRALFLSFAQLEGNEIDWKKGDIKPPDEKSKEKNVVPSAGVLKNHNEMFNKATGQKSASTIVKPVNQQIPVQQLKEAHDERMKVAKFSKSTQHPLNRMLKDLKRS